MHARHTTLVMWWNLWPYLIELKTHYNLSRQIWNLIDLVSNKAEMYPLNGYKIGHKMVPWIPSHRSLTSQVTEKVLVTSCDPALLNTNKSHVVGCHIGPSPSSTSRNRSSILVDCSVNAFFPLLSSMGSYTANIVVLRMVCEVPFLWEKMIPCCLCCSYPPFIAKQHHKPQL